MSILQPGLVAVSNAISDIVQVANTGFTSLQTRHNTLVGNVVVLEANVAALQANVAVLLANDNTVDAEIADLYANLAHRLEGEANTNAMVLGLVDSIVANVSALSVTVAGWPSV